MKFLKKYYTNTSTFQCVECKHIWTLTICQWLSVFVHNDITRHRYVKCPCCGARHWLKAEKVVE